MAYGGRAYDDDKPWWQDDDNDNNNTSSNQQSNNHNTKPSDDFDTPQSNFHGTSSYGNSYGVYSNSKYTSAYDDAHDAYSRYLSKSSTNNSNSTSSTKQSSSSSQSQSQSRKKDPYEAIRARSKQQQKKSKQQQYYQKTNPWANNAYTNNDSDDNNNNNDNEDETDDFDDFDKEPTKKSNPFPDDTYNRYSKSKPKQKPKATHSRSQSSRNIYEQRKIDQHNYYNNKNNGYSSKSSTNLDDDGSSQGVSNPAYRRQLLGNKYRNGHLNDEYNMRKKRAPRVRPELYTLEQQQQYKQQLRQSTMSHLDESLRTAYQSEELAADTSEKLYYQRKKLENVDKMLHETDQNLDRTEHTLKGMKSIWGGINNYFKKAPERQAYEKRKDVDKVNVKNKMMELERQRAQKGYGRHKDVSLGGSKQEDVEFNDKLDDLHKSVQRMRLMAQNMNRELEDQDGLLQNIDDKMSKVDERIHKQNHTMNKIR